MRNVPEEQPLQVTVHTRPDVFMWMNSSLHYDRVIGMRVGDDGTQADYGHTVPDHDEHNFFLPSDMVKGLILTLHRIENVEPINCHLFSRLTRSRYVDEAIRNPTGESWFPIDKYALGVKRKTTSLGAGALGVIRHSGRGSVHSLVGLEEELGLGIQILSHGAELAVVQNEAILNHYREINPSARVDLYEFTEF